MKFSSAAIITTVAAASFVSIDAFALHNNAAQMFAARNVASPYEDSSTALAGRRRKRGKRHGQRKRFGQQDLEDKPSRSLMTPSVSEAEVRSLFSIWNNALATGDSRIVAKRYAKEAILLPTVSDVPRCDFASIKDYFDAFLQKEPQGEILEGDIRIGDGWCQDAGIYEFTMGATGDKVKARYTYVYVYENNQWKIAHHHSSVMPEGIDIATPITEAEVRGLFELWNSALDTLDSDAVAARYAKSGVLLPTVSDVPRTDYDSIKDYFNNFLLMKPQGEILESNVLIGTNWCQDAGIYEFTMGADGTKVKARYSFVYTLEDGQWKIAHHHSSMMPEAQLEGGSSDAAAATSLPESEVRDLFQLWNSALATEDPDMVAKRYSSTPCLLPTVSDVPRTDYDSIKAYFVDFLQKKPQGEILESYVTSGPDWCMDDGIYEFTMGATGDKVKARYSFVYTKEGDEWKICHHHSSQMPEEVVPKASIEEAVEEQEMAMA